MNFDHHNQEVLNASVKNLYSEPQRPPSCLVSSARKSTSGAVCNTFQISDIPVYAFNVCNDETHKKVIKGGKVSKIAKKPKITIKGGTQARKPKIEEGKIVKMDFMAKIVNFNKSNKTVDFEEKYVFSQPKISKNRPISENPELIRENFKNECI